MNGQEGPGNTLGRVKVLADIIFASAMTIMVLTIDLPDPDVVRTDQEIGRFVLDQLATFAIYAITFLLVAVYWMKHLEHFSYYRQTAPGFLWLQVFFLMFLAALPFANVMNSLYSTSFAVHGAYAGNIFAIGMLSFLTWRYATRGHRLVDPDLDEQRIAHVGHEALVEPAVALLSIPIALLSAAVGEATFLLIPVIFAVQKRRQKRRAK